MKYRIEWLNVWTGRVRVSHVKVAERPSDWRSVLKEKHGLTSVLDAHVFGVTEE